MSKDRRLLLMKLDVATKQVLSEVGWLDKKSSNLKTRASHAFSASFIQTLCILHSLAKQLGLTLADEMLQRNVSHRPFAIYEVRRSVQVGSQVLRRAELRRFIPASEKKKNPYLIEPSVLQ